MKRKSLLLIMMFIWMVMSTPIFVRADNQTTDDDWISEDGTYGRCGDYFYSTISDVYDEQGNPVCRIEYYAGTDKVVRVPDEINGEKVYSIERGAFTENTSIEEVYLPDSVEMLGYDAFAGCTSLKKVYLGSLKRGSYNNRLWDIFSNCSSLESISMSDDANFSLIRESGSAYFGNGTFSMNLLKQLKYIYIGSSMEKVSDNLFYGDALEYVEIGENNPNYKSIDGIVYSADGKKLIICGTAYKTEDVVIPEGVEVIESYAFQYCNNIKSITLPSSITKCSGLVDMDGLEKLILKGDVPDNLSSCLSGMSGVTVEYPAKYINNYLELIEKYTNLNWEPDEIVEAKKLKIKKTSGTLKMGETVQLAVSFSPSNTTEREVVWDSSNPDVATVDENGNVTIIGHGVAEIEVRAIAGGKTASYKMNIPHNWDKRTTIEAATAISKGTREYICTECDTAKYVDIPAKGLPKKGKKITDKNTKAVYKVTVSSAKKGTVTYVKSTAKNATTIKIPATIKLDGVTYKVTSIGANAFKNNKKVKQIKIGKNVTQIGKNAFYGCRKLKTITIGKNVTSIGSKAFANCAALTQITIPAKVKTIGSSILSGCKKMKNIIIKSKKLSVKTVSDKGFKGINKKTVIKVPKAKLKTYKKLFRKKGLSKKVNVTKIK